MYGLSELRGNQRLGFTTLELGKVGEGLLSEMDWNSYQKVQKRIFAKRISSL